MNDASIDAPKLRDRFVFDSLRYAPAVVVPAVLSVASVTVFTRTLDTNAYGLYSLALAAVTILTVVGAGWIEQSTLRYLPEYLNAGRSREMIAYILGVTLVTCAAVVVLLAVARLGASTHAGPLGRLFLPAVALLVGEMVFTSLGAVLQARLQSHTLSVFRVLGATMRFAVALGLLLWSRGQVFWVLAGAAIGRALVTLAMLGVVARAQGTWIAPRFDRAMLRRFGAYGAPMVGWTVGSQVLGLSDRFAIGAFHGSGQVGIYSANYNLVTMGFGLLSTPLLMAAHPLIITAWDRHGAADAPKIIAQFSRIYVIALVPVIAVLAVCSHEVATILLGEAFREGSRIIPIMVAGTFVWGFGMYGHKGLEIAERTNVMFGLVAATALLNIGLNLVFIPRYGYIAAAYTTLACYVVYPVLVHRASRRHIPWLIPWRTVFEAVAAGLIAVAAAVLVRHALPWRQPVAVVAATGLVALAVYAALLAGRYRGRAGAGGAAS